MSKLLEYHDKKSSTYYVGPLDAGRVVAARVTSDSEPDVSTLDAGGYMVATENAWGTGQTLDEAWRYFLGAVFGPADDGYNEADLLAELDKAADR
jgi:hypothetical protein